MLLLTKGSIFLRAVFSPVLTEFDSPSRQLLGLSDMEITTISGRTYLLVAGAADGGISSYEILNDGPLVPSSDILLSSGSGTQSISDLSVFSIGASSYVLGSGMADNNQVVYDLGADGSLTLSVSYSDAASTYANWNMTTTIEIAGNTYMYGAIWGQPGFFQFDIGAGGVLGNPVLHPDSPLLFLGDVTAVHAANLRGNDFLFVASGADAGLHCYAVAPDGSVQLRDTAAPLEGGFSGVSELVAVDVAGRSFVIMASAGTDSLVTFRVSSNGMINHVQTITDTADTRFAGVTALEVFEHNGRVFLLAGGADDGITLFEITYKGKLNVLASIADDASMAMQNVTDIEAVFINGVLNVFVSSATDHGFTQFTIDIPNGNNLITGGPVAETLTGTSLDDTIYGRGKNDNLYGMDGDDRLIDGRGKDHMWGGNGADVFEFIDENSDDYIMDFEILQDRIDLSDYDLINNISDLTITPTATGAIIEVAGDFIYITSFDDTSLSVDLFTQDHFIF